MTKLTNQSQKALEDTNINCSNSDEIDLKELLISLWDGRLIIIAVTLLVTIAAAAYAFLSTPVYSSDVKLNAPLETSQTSLSGAYYAIENVEQENSPFSSETLNKVKAATYQEFVDTASSLVTQLSFFEEHPKFGSNAAINVNTSGTKPNVSTTISVSGSNAEHVAEIANEYANYAITKTEKKIVNSLFTRKETIRESLTAQADSLRMIAPLQRKQRIASLQESLLLAESLNLEDLAETGNLLVTLTQETAYLRGADALRNEIYLLENRSSDDDFIPELIKINQHLNLLDSININTSDIQVAQVDRPAFVTSTPVKPRKNLIIAIGLVLGGMLGIFLVLMRNMFRE